MDMPIGLFCSVRDATSGLELINSSEAQCRRGFVRSETPVYGAAIEDWIDENIAQDQIVLTSASTSGANDAVLSGLGAGFLPRFFARRLEFITELMPPRPDWVVPIWGVTHVDLHRSAKVQNFLGLIKKLPSIRRAGQSMSMNAIDKQNSSAQFVEFCSNYTPQAVS